MDSPTHLTGRGSTSRTSGYWSSHSPASDQTQTCLYVRSKATHGIRRHPVNQHVYCTLTFEAL